MSLGDKKGQWASWRMMFPPIKDLFNAGLFLPVRKQFSKRGSAQLQDHVLFLSFVEKNVLTGFELDTAGDDSSDCTSKRICLDKSSLTTQLTRQFDKN